jgi:hypothetical protein
MAITLREVLNQSKITVLILIQVSDDTTLTEARQVRGNAQDPSRKIMTPWMFDIKFSLITQFTFGSLTFAAVKMENSRCCLQGQHQSVTRRQMDKFHGL